MHLNCIGADAPGKEELEPEILKRAKIIVDDIEQAVHSGEINVPISKGILTEHDIWAEIGEVVAKIKPGRESEEEITIFTSTGLARNVGCFNYKFALNVVDVSLGNYIWPCAGNGFLDAIHSNYFA